MEYYVRIKRILKESLTELSVIFSTSFIAKVERKKFDLLDAVTRIIIGQMLSRKAADTIFKRACSIASMHNIKNISSLSYEQLVSAGVSSRKSKCIKLFHNNYNNDSEKYDSYLNLPYNKLRKEMVNEWGIGDWTVDMLSIFYIGHEDVFPESDKTIINAVNKYYKFNFESFQHDKASPYRSFLALYLWNAYDENIPISPIANRSRR